MIKALLQVKPSLRPTCDQILNMQSVNGNLGQTLMVGDIQSIVGSEGLIGTIKVPRNLGVLSQALPKANYNQPAYVKRAASAETRELVNLRSKPKADYASAQSSRPISRGVIRPLLADDQRVTKSNPQLINQRKVGLVESSSQKVELVLPKIYESRLQRLQSEDPRQGARNRSPLAPVTNQNYAQKAALYASPQKPGSRVLQIGGLSNVLRKDGPSSPYAPAGPLSKINESNNSRDVGQRQRVSPIHLSPKQPQLVKIQARRL